MAVVCDTASHQPRACVSVAVLPESYSVWYDHVRIPITLLTPVLADVPTRNTHLAGTVMFVCIAQIPQRFVTVNGLSPLSSAVRLLTYGAFVPFGSGLAGALMGKPRIPPCWIVLAGSVMEVIGIVLLSRIDTSSRIDSTQYAFQIIAGTGTGLVNAGLIILVPYAMEKRDLGKPHSPTLRPFIDIDSNRLGSDIPISHLGRAGRHSHRHFRLYALHSLPLEGYCPSGACNEPLGEDGTDTATSSRYPGASANAVRGSVQSAS